MTLSLISRWLNRPPQVPRRWSDQPCMPESPAEAEQVFRRWDELNGRYYFKADLLLEGGRFLLDVVFDGDSRIAVEYGRRPIYLQHADLISQAVLAWLVTMDYSSGRTFGNATEDERRRFQETHAGGPTALPS